MRQSWLMSVKRDSLLPAIDQPAYQTDEVRQLVAKLKDINLKLWKLKMKSG